MKRSNFTEERPDFTREDMAKLLALGPRKSRKNRDAFVRDSLEKAGLPADEIEKIVSDLDSYQMLDE